MHAAKESPSIRRPTGTNASRSARPPSHPHAPAGPGFLNRYLGNHYVQRKCAACQEDDRQRGLLRKSAVGPANDAFEQEADRVAEHVMGMAAPASAGLASPPGIRRLPEE